MLDRLRKLLETQAQVQAGSTVEVRPGIHLKAKPLIKMECRIWRDREQRWEDGPPIESIEVIIS